MIAPTHKIRCETSAPNCLLEGCAIRRVQMCQLKRLFRLRSIASPVEVMRAARAAATAQESRIHLGPRDNGAAALALHRHEDVENLPFEDTLLIWRKASLAPGDYLSCDTDRHPVVGTTVLKISVVDQMAQKSFSVF